MKFRLRDHRSSQAAAETIDELIDDADRAMYQTKRRRFGYRLTSRAGRLKRI
jgi:hypothetical protein